MLASVVAALGTYVFFGLHLWLLADTREGLTISPLSLCIGTMAIAMLAGLAFFMLPSGVGAREFVIVVALSPVVGIGRATAYAAVSRAMFILAELVSAGTAAGLLLLKQRRRAIRTRESEEPLWQTCFTAMPARCREFEPGSKGRKETPVTVPAVMA